MCEKERERHVTIHKHCSFSWCVRNKNLQNSSHLACVCVCNNHRTRERFALILMLVSINRIHWRILAVIKIRKKKNITDVCTKTHKRFCTHLEINSLNI